MLNGKVVQGICGWSDQSLASCGRFFPPRTRESVDKLRFISSHSPFGCIEVDSSTYAIPSVANVTKWVECTPQDFTFHFKAFMIFCQNGCGVDHLPVAVRSSIQSSGKIRNGWILLRDLSTDIQKELWKLFNEALKPALTMNKLGAVVFQFQSNFAPSESSRSHVQYCANELDCRYKIAIEFRNRAWFDSDHLDDTLSWLRSLRPEGVALIASDDLAHEMRPHEERQHGPRPGEMITSLSTVLTSRGCESFLYIRVHRREGSHRLLSDDEISRWVERIKIAVQGSESSSLINTSKGAPVAPEARLTGPIYFLWATDHEEQPLLNAINLFKALPSVLMFDWKTYALGRIKSQGIAGMFSRQMMSNVSSNGPALVAGGGSVESVVDATLNFCDKRCLDDAAQVHTNEAATEINATKRQKHVGKQPAVILPDDKCESNIAGDREVRGMCCDESEAAVDTRSTSSAQGLSDESAGSAGVCSGPASIIGLSDVPAAVAAVEEAPASPISPTALAAAPTVSSPSFRSVRNTNQTSYQTQRSGTDKGVRGKTSPGVGLKIKAITSFFPKKT